MRNQISLGRKKLLPNVRWHLHTFKPSAFMREVIMKKVLSLFFLIGLSSALYGQDWTSPIAGNRNPNFYSVQQSFNTYWQNKDITVTKGWKAYKRWENFWESRVAKDGTFPAFNVVEKEWNAYLATHTPLAAGGWTSVGPATSSSGYNGIGRINCLAFHPTDVNTIWVGTPAGGLWKTTNGGSSWSNNSDDFPSLGVSAIAIHPTTPTTMYIGTGDGDGYDTYFYGMRKSIDGGTTWTTVAMPGSQPNVARKIIINPTNPSTVIAATDNGLYQSTNDGVSWILATPGNMYDLEFKPGDPSIVYASSRTEIFKSTNGGSTWTSVRSITGSNRIALAVSPANPALVVALSSSSADNGFNGVYTSNNSGVSFSTTATTPNLLGWAKDGADTGGQGYYDLDIVISPTDANTIFVGGVNTWKSTNGGTSWTINTFWYDDGSATQAVHADKHFLGYQNGSTTLFQGCDGGIYKTTNGTNWTDLSAGLVISQMYKLGTAQTSDAVMVGLQDNSSKAKLPGLSWVDIASTGDGMEGAIDPTNDKVQYTESYYGNIRRITLNASYQKIAEVGIKPVGQSGAWVTPFVIDPNNASTIYIGFKDIFKSTDKGTTWTQISTSLSTSNMTNIAVAPSNSNYIYVSSGSSMFKTTNGGSSWTSVTQPTGGWISYIMVNPAAPSTVYITLSNAGSGQKVYKSTDGGGTWTNISGTLPNLSINCITYQKTTNDALYIGTDVGIFYRDGTMNDWITFKAGLPNVIVNELEINYSNNKILAATYGRGLWESNLYSVGPQTCSIPSNLNTSGVLSTEANLSWSGTSIATSYTVQYRAILPATIKRPTTRGKQSDAIPIIQNGIVVGYTYPKANTNNPLNGELWTTITVNSNNAVLTGLSPNTQYEFQVKSNCTGEASVFSASANFTTLSGDCAKVPTTYGANTNTYIGYTNFNWQTQTDVLAYKVEWKRVSDTEWNFDYVNSPYTYYGLYSLEPATKYEWRVSSICLNEVESAPSAIKTFTTPAPACLGTASTPILSLNNVWANAASIFWTATYGKGYVFAYRKTSETAWSYRTFSTNTYLQLDGLLPSTAYECKVKAVCDGVNEAYSNVVTFTTQADACASRLVPLADYSATNITATSATLKWSAIPGVTSYRLEIYGFPIQTVSGTSYNMTGLTTATWYSFRVSPICATGSPYLYPNTYTFRTTGIDCQAPYPLTGLASSTATTAKVYWGAVGGATGYKVQYRIADPTNYSNSSNAWTTFTTTNTNFEFTGLAPQTSYDYRITTSTDGCWYVYNTVTTTEAAPCDAPTNLYASTSTLYGYTYLSWKGSASAIDYTVQYRVVGSNAAWKSAKVAARGVQTPLDPRIADTPFQSFTANVSGDWVTDYTTQTYYYIEKGILDPATNYEFQVEANCQSGLSGFSEIKTFRTPNPACTDIANLRLGGAVSNSAWVTWDNVYGPGANVLYKKTTDLTWTSLSTMGNFAEFGNLTPGATYQVKVRIRCLAEELVDASINTRYQEITFTTPASTCRTLAIAPGDITASLVTTTTAKVTWKALTGVTKYHVLIYGPNGLLSDQQVTGISLDLTNLLANSSYSVNVRGICTDGEAYWWTYTRFVTAGSTVCYAPSYNQQVLVTTTTAKISLYQLGGVANYKIEYKRPDETIWTSKSVAPTSNSFDITGLLDNTYYDFKIRSVCGTVDGPYYTSGNFTTVALPCKAPTLLSSVLNTTTSSATTIKWTGVLGITRYAVQYRKPTEAWPTTATEVFVTPTTNVYQYQLTGLAEFTDYEIRVKTLCNNVDESDYTAVLKVKTNVFCRVPSYSISNVTLSSFKVNITAVTGAIGYEVYYRKYDVNSPNALWTAKNPTGTNLFSDITGLLPGTKYEVRVRTKCSTTNFSDYSTTTVETLPCSNVSSYTLTDLKNTSVRVNWPAIPGVLGYEIEYRKAGLTPEALYTKKIATATATFVDITGLVASTLYDIRIRVKCTTTGFSDYSSSQFKTLCAPPAAAPTVSFIGPKSAYVKWSAVVGVNYYKLQWKKTAAAATEWRESGLLYRDIYLADLLEPATSYQVRVVSVCDNVNGVFSAPSPIATFTTTALTCNETTEPNNTALTAKLITTTTPLRAKISTSTDEDWFKITATAFTAIYLSDLPANYDLYLYNSTGTQIASQSTNTGTYRDIVYTSAGTYLIQVKSAAGAFDASNCYNLAAVVPIPSVGTTQSSIVFDSDDIIQQPKLSSDFGLNGIDQLTVAPNPTSGMLQLYIKSAESGVGQLIISDYTGRIVVNMKDLSLDEGEQMKEVDLSKFSNGIYLIRLIKGENILTSKIQLIKN